MIAKLRENPDKIPSPSRDDIMKMCKAACKPAFEETIAKSDVSNASKKNSLTIKLIIKAWQSKLWRQPGLGLGWNERIHSVLLSKPHPTTLNKLQEVMIPPDGIKQKLDRVVDDVPPDEGCEVLDGELTEEE